MPTLEGAQQAAFIKLILIGDSGTGKTGALASLVKSGYRLHVLDFDNKLAGGILPILLKRDAPEKLKEVDYVALRDEFRATPAGPVVDGVPKAYAEGLKLMDKWTDGSVPKQWGQETIFVLDSLTFFADGAFNWARAMNPSAKDPRQWFYTAQQGVENTLALLCSVHFQTHVVVISHVNWMNRPDGTMKGYPSAVGQALGPTIPAYFENMALCETNAGKRYIRTTPTALVDLKNPAAFKMAPQLPIETGLADFFKTLRS
jgi:hypothetical protein